MPRDDRFWPGGPARFRAGILELIVVEEGSGRKVGVVGRDVGVRGVLVVETVLVLSLPSADRRDCGRRIPDFPKFVSDRDEEIDETRILVDLSRDDLLRSIESSRKGDEDGLDNLRRLFSLSFCGEGVICSSMISTQPEVSAADADFVASEELDFPPGSDSILLLTLTLRVSGVLNS